MGNNQGNQKGAAQDRRERANLVEKGDSKDSAKNPRGRQVHRDNDVAKPGVPHGVASDPDAKQS